MIIDVHTHTEILSNGPLKASDLRAYIERTRVVERAKRLGLDGICLTEHDRTWPAEVLREVSAEYSFLFLPGMEVSTNYADYGHVLSYGLDSYIGGIWDVKRLKQVINDVGGVLIVAHPFRELLTLWPNHPTRRITLEDACKMPIFQLVDGIEAYNGATIEQENDFAWEVCRHLEMPAVGGSDAHSVMGIGSCATVFEDPITSGEELVRALKAGRYRPAVRRNGVYVPL